MERLLLFCLLALTYSCTVNKPNQLVKQTDVERIIRTLCSDEMQGRAIFSPGIEKAAQFIESEFKQIGLQPLAGQTGYRQNFSLLNIAPKTVNVRVNGAEIEKENILVVTDKSSLKWTEKSGIEVHHIKEGETFMTRYRTIMATDKPAIVFVDEQFLDAFNKVRDFFMNERVVSEPNEKRAAVFILGEENSQTFQVDFSNELSKAPLFNVAGILPGKTRANELVIFSGHYDHIGVIGEENGDSIANGADDDASGITAVISLAKYYKKLNNNARTLIFVAFTGEESGMMGSKYFSNQLNAADVVAMFNMEMIGKEAKFGKNTAFITGFEKSDFGAILQKNLADTDFSFHPDPYASQNLFYRSDNATLAALGVPAHTISTVQIDKDKYYHTVDDELETLDVSNITATISAIALSSRSIVSGADTPKRIPPLETKP